MKQIIEGGIARNGLEKLYSSFKHMHSRCYKSYNKAYKNYGARGISVCSEWFVFSEFADWAMHNGWKKGLTLERINVDGNYEPNNCCWKTRKEQNQNTRRTHKLQNGEAGIKLAKENNVPPSTFTSRIAMGWPVELAATAPRGARLKSLLKRSI